MRVSHHGEGGPTAVSSSLNLQSFHLNLPGTFAMMKAILQTLRQDDQDPDYSTDDDTDEELRWSNWVSRWNKSMHP